MLLIQFRDIIMFFCVQHAHYLTTLHLNSVKLIWFSAFCFCFMDFIELVISNYTQISFRSISLYLVFLLYHIINHLLLHQYKLYFKFYYTYFTFRSFFFNLIYYDFFKPCVAITYHHFFYLSFDFETGNLN